MLQTSIMKKFQSAVVSLIKYVLHFENVVLFKSIFFDKNNYFVIPESRAQNTIYFFLFFLLVSFH